MISWLKETIWKSVEVIHLLMKLIHSVKDGFHNSWTVWQFIVFSSRKGKSKELWFKYTIFNLVQIGHLIIHISWG
jgi:hypothetical protein